MVRLDYMTTWKYNNLGVSYFLQNIYETYIKMLHREAPYSNGYQKKMYAS